MSRNVVHPPALHLEDVVLIGSGLGSLSCAAVLAAAGRRVTLCESHYRRRTWRQTLQPFLAGAGVAGRYPKIFVDPKKWTLLK